MNSLYTNEDDTNETSDSPEREISLSTASVLGIFFALALVCAIFFGFGYTMGRRSGAPVAAATVPSSAAPSANNSPKPSPNGIIAALPSSSNSGSDTRSRTPDTSGNAHNASARLAPVLGHTTPAPAPTAAQLPAAPATSPTGTFIVQVAAVSHHEDADVLVASLKQRGYDVSLRQVPQDKLLHVQLGPFATRKDADLMRQRLLANGYNAIVK